MQFETVTAYIKYYVYIKRYDRQYNCFDGETKYGPFHNHEIAEELLVGLGFSKGALYYEKGQDTTALIIRKLEEDQ